MIIEAALIIHMDLSVRPEFDKHRLTKGDFQYDWRDSPPPPIADGPDDDEALFRMLIETMERESREAREPKAPFRSTMEPWLGR